MLKSAVEINDPLQQVKMLLQLCPLWLGGIFVLEDFLPGFSAVFPILIKAENLTLPGFHVAGSRSSTGSECGIYPTIHLFCKHVFFPANAFVGTCKGTCLSIEL